MKTKKEFEESLNTACQEYQNLINDEISRATSPVFRERMRQIKKSREKFNNDMGTGDTILSADCFMDIISRYIKHPTLYSWCDVPSCAYFGIYDVEKYENYYCPIEDLTEEEIIRIDGVKPKPPKE